MLSSFDGFDIPSSETAVTRNNSKAKSHLKSMYYLNNYYVFICDSFVTLQNIFTL